MDYIIDGEEIQTLQVVLQPGRKLTVDLNAVCWCNETLVLRSKGLFLAQLFSPYSTSSMGEALNHSTSPGIICLNQSESGKILVLKMENRPSLYCFKDCFVCASDEVNILPKMMPLEISFLTIGIPNLFNRAHFCSGSSGKIFLQSGGTIMNKELKRGEHITIKLNCMVGFDETCSITAVTPIQSSIPFFSVFASKDTFLKITGPGNVYFCAHTTARKSSNFVKSRMHMNSTVQANASVIGLLLYILIILFSFYTLSQMLGKIAIEFEQLDGNNLLRF